MLDFFLNGVKIEVDRSGDTFVLQYPCGSDHTNCFPYFCVLPPGSFQFQVWDGSGGTTNEYYIGYGGYSEGIIELHEPTEAYFLLVLKVFQ